MRKYIQLVVVTLLFSSAVLFRHLRSEDAGPPSVLGAGLENRDQVTNPPTTVYVFSTATASVPSRDAPTATATAAATPAVVTAPRLPTTPPGAAEVKAAASATPISTPSATPAAEATSPTSKAGNETSTPQTGSVTSTPRPRTYPSLFAGSVFKDGDFDSPPERMTYGMVRVRVTMKDGWIEQVTVLDYPDRTDSSAKMSIKSLPLLTAQAIERQDWDVDVITGATQTSESFKRAMVRALRASEAAAAGSAS